MKTLRACRTAFSVLIAFASQTLHADPWPQFRGPAGQGSSAETSFPLHWSATNNVAWKTPVPGESWSSPIVWSNHVFLTTATDGGTNCHVLALDRRSGAVLWNKEVFKQAIRRKEGRNTFATPTPATDGHLVYTCFGDGSFAALTFAGDIAWTNRAQPHYSHHGLASSLLFHQNLLIMARDGSSDGEDKNLGWLTPWDQSFILALDTRTGQERWKARRGLSRISHGAPALYTHAGVTQVVSEAGDVVQGFNIETGERLWSSTVIGEGKVPSTVVGNGLVFTSGGWGGRESIKAFHIEGRGDLGTNNLAWEQRKGMPKVPTLLFVTPHLLAITDTGTATCMLAATGEIVWQNRLDARFSASPVASADRIYLVSDDGETFVIQAGAEFKILARNPLGEKVQATPALSQGQIFIRTESNVFAIGNP